MGLMVLAYDRLATKFGESSNLRLLVPLNVPLNLNRSILMFCCKIGCLVKLCNFVECTYLFAALLDEQVLALLKGLAPSFSYQVPYGYATCTSLIRLSALPSRHPSSQPSSQPIQGPGCLKTTKKRSGSRGSRGSGDRGNRSRGSTGLFP
jgi:hypothetical protein